jgi:membrane-associated phospholipid phosphatase
MTEGGHDRRGFLRVLGGAFAAASVGVPGSLAKTPGTAERPKEALRGGGALRGRLRARRALQVRTDAARRQNVYPIPVHRSNGDDERYSNKIASYSKGLPHNRLGEVDPKAYRMLMRAISTGDSAEFERVRLAGVRPLTNPQGGLAYTMQGADAQHLGMPPAPAFSSREQAAEIVENYWMALARDVPFADYAHNPITNAAAADLSRMPGFRGPRIDGKVTPATLFRGDAYGMLDGPFVSQFLLKDTPFGAERVSRRMRTAVPGVDYMVTYSDWLAGQNGFAAAPQRFDRTYRYMRNGRDLGEWVHNDVLFQAYFNALLILFDMQAPLDPLNPYNDVAVYRGRVAGRYWRNQGGFGTFGAPYVASLVCAVAKPALAAVWFQKWFVHRRLRPETFGGRIHNHLTEKAAYPIHRDALESAVLQAVSKKNGTYLLPQAYPEGAPTHPSYGAGHATVAGACVTVLKAFFDESYIIPNPVEPAVSGQAIALYAGPYVRTELTVGGELNKLAANIAIGRNFAGIHWRSDFIESLTLGEEVALHFLEDERRSVNEKFGGFSLTRFDGRKVVV